MSTKENTWRILKELKPIQPWRCRLGWHRWTSYETLEKLDYNTTVYARCNCADCGLPRLETAYTTSKK